MTFSLSAETLQSTTCEALAKHREYSTRSFRQDAEVSIPTEKLSKDDLQDILRAAEKNKDAKVVRALEAILKAREGKLDVPIPSFKAFSEVFTAFMKSGLIDGWLYEEGRDGNIYPYLVTSISYDEGRAQKGEVKNPVFRVHLASYTVGGGRSGAPGFQNDSITFHPQDVTKRRIADALLNKGYMHETTGLKAQHDKHMSRFDADFRRAFTKQLRINGRALRYAGDDYKHVDLAINGARVVHDLELSEFGTYRNEVDSFLFEAGDGMGSVPEHPLVRVVDLRSQDSFWVHSAMLEIYKYDLSLRDKLVLPESHRDLLDVLTNDMDAFVEDIVEGKTASNVILCKGPAGVGKTLTAEVYCELIQRPLYSVHAGTLGTEASTIARNLRKIFAQAKRLKCVILLDEADVFVAKRKENIQQNAIVAEFLRTLEYFEELMFMTTNRPDDIDEAFINRCAAVIAYKCPSKNDAFHIWKVMGSHFQHELDDELIKSLVEMFPDIAPRTIKNLFRLTLRVCLGKKKSVDLDQFRRCAMFRGVEMPVESSK